MLKEEIEAVEKLGNEIGYGNMMGIASAIWAKKLQNDGFGIDGVFIPSLLMDLNKQAQKEAIAQREIYFQWINRLTNY